MTVNELLTYQESVYPSQYPNATKIIWLNTVEKQIHDYLSQFDADIEEFEPHTTQDLTEDLLIDEPDVYANYLGAMIDFSNGEYNRYNNKVAMYNTMMSDWQAMYIRTHSPINDKFIGI